MARTIIISNRLPVTVSRNDDGVLQFKPSAGGLATGLSSIYKEENNLWLGWPGLHSLPKHDQEEVAEQLSKDHMAPVFLTEEDIELYYEGFSNNTIWPLFHYFTQFTTYDPSLWDAYVKVNEKFCEELIKVASPEDTIWVHDYQLLLLPQMIREKLPNASIGFFQHIPFPSYEIFRLLPWREELLKGMLGADLTGFHTYDDMRHFASSVSRLIGAEPTMGVIKWDNRLVACDAFPMGIDYEKFSSAVGSPGTVEKVRRYSRLMEDQQIVLSIDRLDYTKGIKKRLEAFDTFLEQYPEFIGKVSILLIIVPSRDKVEQYQNLKEEIDMMVGRMDGKYSRMDWQPIHYFYRGFSFNGLSALYSSAKVALITPLRDGMNLVCKEYIASRVDKTGVLILSEMAGASKELSEAIQINPNDNQQIVDALYQALTMPEEEQIERMTLMQNKLKRYNVFHWVDVFIKQLNNIKKSQEELHMRQISEKVTEDLVGVYQKASSRVLFLDYDGTLKAFSNDPQSVVPDEELLDILTELTNKKENKVVIISGRDKNTLEQWVGHLPVDIIAEHGVWTRHYQGEWETIDVLSDDWKPQIRGVLEQFVDRTPGSFIEEKDFSLVWHFRMAEKDFGDLRAREMVSYLGYLTGNMDLHIMQGNKVVEIKHQAVNKGRAAKKWLGQHETDFVFAIGDDVTDEDTFMAMPDDAYTVKVGLTASQARFNIPSTVEVRSLLKKLC